MKKWILTFGVLILFLAGCSGRLTREKAAQMIVRREPQFASPVSIQISLGSLWNGKPEFKPNECFGALEPETIWARDQGFVQIQSGPEKSLVSLTSKGKTAEHLHIQRTKENPCETSMIGIARLGKPEVTGIVTEGSKAEVEFDYQVIPINGSDSLFSDPSKVSEVGKHAIMYQISDFPPPYLGKNKGYIGFGSATFVKYDDGWRAESVLTIRTH